jgi:hypothetical protein
VQGSLILNPSQEEVHIHKLIKGLALKLHALITGQLQHQSVVFSGVSQEDTKTTTKFQFMK